MKRLIIVVIVIAFVACGKKMMYAATSNSSTSVHNISKNELANMQQGILEDINAYRQKKGKPPLVMVDAANLEAAKHSTNMATGASAFGHQGFEERSTRIMKQISGIQATAENVAYGYMTADEVVDGWINSTGHRKNIEGNYNLTGIGLAKGKDGNIYYTQIFLNKP